MVPPQEQGAESWAELGCFPGREPGCEVEQPGPTGCCVLRATSPAEPWILTRKPRSGFITPVIGKVGFHVRRAWNTPGSTLSRSGLSRTLHPRPCCHRPPLGGSEPPVLGWWLSRGPPYERPCPPQPDLGPWRGRGGVLSGHCSGCALGQWREDCSQRHIHLSLPCPVVGTGSKGVLSCSTACGRVCASEWRVRMCVVDVSVCILTGVCPGNLFQTP